MRIPLKKLAQYAHMKFIIKLEKQALLAYQYIMESLKDEIIAELKQDRLLKSELPKGWTGEVAKIEIDVGKRVSKVLQKHFAALRWLIYGKAAGKEAAEAAKALKLVDKVVPGILNGAYLQSVDSHRDHYKAIFEKVAPELSKRLMSATMKQINIKSDVFFQAFLEQTRMQLLAAINKIQESINFSNINQAFIDSHDHLPTSETPSEAVDKGTDDIDARMPTKILDKELSAVIDKQEYAWDKMAQSQINMASSIGTHQSFVEIFGQNNREIRVVLITVEDEKLCDFCNKTSKKADGSYKYYRLNQLMPSGYNYGRKKVDWKFQIGIQHPNCRCLLCYVPAGFEVDTDGSIKKSES